MVFFRKWEIMARSKFEIWAYHLKELLISFQKIIKSLKLDRQNSSNYANCTLNKTFICEYLSCVAHRCDVPVWPLVSPCLQSGHGNCCPSDPRSLGACCWDSVQTSGNWQKRLGQTDLPDTSTWTGQNDGWGRIGTWTADFCCERMPTIRGCLVALIWWLSPDKGEELYYIVTRQRG